MAYQEAARRTMGSIGTINDILADADVLYAWLQNAPMKDADHDNKFWFDSSTQTKPKDK